MRQRIVLGFLIGLFLITSNSTIFSEQLFGGGYVFEVHLKQGNSILTFNLPDVYLQDDDSLVVPIQLKIMKGKNILTTIQSQNTTLILPVLDWQKGNYIFEVSIGSYSNSQELNL